MTDVSRHTESTSARMDRKAFARWLDEHRDESLKGGVCPLTHFCGQHVSHTHVGSQRLPRWARTFVQAIDAEIAVPWADERNHYSVASVRAVFDALTDDLESAQQSGEKPCP
jgi:hypothetical protein